MAVASIRDNWKVGAQLSMRNRLFKALLKVPYYVLVPILAFAPIYQTYKWSKREAYLIAEVEFEKWRNPCCIETELQDIEKLRSLFGVGFEILDQLQWQTPKNIVCPMGNGTLMYAVYKGCLEMKQAGFIKKMPRLIGVQAKGCNPIVRAFKEKQKEITAIKNPKTIAGAINCGNPVDGLEALHALRQTKGVAEEVTDKQIKQAKKELGEEGVYAETSSAATLAAAKKLGLRGQTIMVITGHGLKE